MHIYKMPYFVIKSLKLNKYMSPYAPTSKMDTLCLKSRNHCMNTLYNVIMYQTNVI